MQKSVFPTVIIYRTFKRLKVASYMTDAHLFKIEFECKIKQFKFQFFECFLPV